MECSIWSAPNSDAQYRVKKVPAGYQITVDTNVITGKDGKHYYKTKKGSYIMTKCVMYPVDFTTMEPYTGNKGFNVVSSKTDTQGNEYAKSLMTEDYGIDSRWATWELNGQYVVFSGTAFWYSARKGYNDYYVEYNFYGDGALLYSITMNGASKATPFSFSVAGVMDLKIEARGYSSNGKERSSYALIGNPTIYKAVQ